MMKKENQKVCTKPETPNTVYEGNKNAALLWTELCYLNIHMSNTQPPVFQNVIVFGD